MSEAAVALDASASSTPIYDAVRRALGVEDPVGPDTPAASGPGSGSGDAGPPLRGE